MKKGDHLFLVDGSGYIFRAYHALPPLTRKSDGLPVGAVSGFCNMLWKLMQDARNTDVGVTPTHLAVIFDYSSKTFRNELYPEYKANRSAPPEDLIPQFGLIRQATQAPFDLPCIEMEGFEADDLIATYCRLAAGGGRRRYDHLIRQGPDAARRSGGVDVRPDERQARSRCPRSSRSGACRRRR
jgi:DNA polymerase-1